MKTHHNLFFTTFLILYGGFLLVHVWETGFSSWQALAAIFGGMALAIVAHRKHGFAPSVFLVGHMLIEWYHHALHSNHYTSGEFFFHGVHALLDLVFLIIEAKAHYKKYAYVFLLLVIAVLAFIFMWNHVSAHPPSFAISPLVAQALEVQKQMGVGHTHKHDGGLIHSMVIGGMLGCVISHLFLSSKWKHIHRD